MPPTRKPTAAELKKQLADLKAQSAAVEAQLAKIKTRPQTQRQRLGLGRGATLEDVEMAIDLLKDKKDPNFTVDRKFLSGLRKDFVKKKNVLPTPKQRKRWNRQKDGQKLRRMLLLR